ncbi:BZ3500_MvSof-1268-A1-R1_Chr1-1g01250 [Microbotryum saponariae]|uniref:BZ3500_MvSof-1268-A1-R1_Chr1-1g01250 protein n=1 Tax=Microbotryum saponariae TaxID=289078 RepID=A0A2X0KDG5_9BASI|nr:BZ3500_MvSof-1268-A1-R1_Chr1-1g01250 [Microbotryum saponariae]SCZ93786.1 BZ3501_MvSof-1269-A2-R1_Chr1-1g00846 [Microbotryum saponariae]
MGLFKRKSSTGTDSPKPDKEKVKWSHRPANTAFKQQRLKAWQPILTPATVLPTFFLIGVIFVPLGGVLLWGSNKVKEFTIDYTQCEFKAPNTTFEALPSSAYSYHLGSSVDTAQAVVPTWQFTHDETRPVGQRSLCRLQFSLPVELTRPVFMYYKMTNYYQNHRRYVKSIVSGQLKGDATSASSLSGGDCKPVDVRDGLPIYPCGLIANSFFNDTFLPPVLTNPSGAEGNVTYNMTDKGIAWPNEAKKYGVTKYQIGGAVPPPNWAESYPDGYTASTGFPDLHDDEHFQIWMRTAGLPTFRKLYFRNDEENMAAGIYELDIRMNYPVAPFSGTKSIVFSTVSFIGGRNPFLGYAYIVVGGVCIILGLALTLRHLIKPRKLVCFRFRLDVEELGMSWNRAGPNPASTK